MVQKQYNKIVFNLMRKGQKDRLSLIWGASIIPCTLKGYFGRKSVGSLEAFRFLKVVDHVTNCPSRPKRLKRVRLKRGGGGE